MGKVAVGVEKITAQTMVYLPAVMAGVMVAQESDAAGADKHAAVLDAVIAGSGALAGAAGANPDVAAVSGLINLAVSILKALGVFKRRPSVVPAQP